MINKYIKNPKALNLAAIKNSDTNVTLGFKCEPALKLLLAKDAENVGMTLSSYVNQLIISHNEIINQISKREKEKNERFADKNRILNEKVAFYENEILQNLFQMNKNKKVTYLNKEGETVNHQILTIGDTYLALINSFKTNK